MFLYFFNPEIKKGAKKINKEKKSLNIHTLLIISKLVKK